MLNATNFAAKITNQLDEGLREDIANKWWNEDIDARERDMERDAADRENEFDSRAYLNDEIDAAYDRWREGR